jgi:hypothetical protein
LHSLYHQKDYLETHLIMITNFKSPDHETEYYKIFNEKVEQRYYMLQQVLQAFYGKGDYVRLETIDGRTLQVFMDLTSSLAYEADSNFKDVHPEYKDDIDGMFFTRDQVKDTIIAAIAETNQGEKE